jgi:hypothetical protein
MLSQSASCTRRCAAASSSCSVRSSPSQRCSVAAGLRPRSATSTLEKKLRSRASLDRISSLAWRGGSREEVSERDAHR